MDLHELNFRNLICYPIDNTIEYSFADYRRNGFRHPKAVSYCTDCEEKGYVPCADSNFKLCNISHGAHSIDFLESANIPITNDWNDAGVMFIMEGPSKDYGIYEEVKVISKGKEYHKHPSKEWYWVHENCKISGYPEHFKGGQYGDFVASAIVTFKLSNAYLTNLIKCGLNNPEKDEYKGIDSYNEACIGNCIDRFLRREIDIIQPKVIFTFGSRVYDKVREMNGESVKIVGLPHPAGRRRGFKDEYYNTLYFCMIAKWLRKTGVIQKDFYLELMETFAKNE